MIIDEGKWILKRALKARNMTQGELASKMGMTQCSVSGNMNRDRVSLNVFKNILNALDYDIVITDRQTGELMWMVDPKPERVGK